MTMLASQITSLMVVYSIVYSGVNQRIHQSSASLAFVREIHRGPVYFPHQWPVTRKMFPFDDVIMQHHLIFITISSTLKSWKTLAYAVELLHYSDVIMGTMASQITSLTIVYSTVYSGADQRKHQSSAPLAFVRGIHRSPANSPHKWPVTWMTSSWRIQDTFTTSTYQLHLVDFGSIVCSNHVCLHKCYCFSHWNGKVAMLTTFSSTMRPFRFILY